MSDTIKTVTEKFKFETGSAISALKSLISRTKELKSEINSTNTAKVNVSAYDVQIKKIGQLKNSISNLKSLYSQLNSAISKQDTAVANRNATFPGLPDYQKYTSQINQYESLIDSIREKISDALGMQGNAFSGGDVQAKIYELTQSLKGEESALKSLRSATDSESKATEQSGNAAKSAASKHRSFANAAKNVKSCISSAFSHIKSFTSGIKNAIPGTNRFGGALGKLAAQFKKLFITRILRNLISSITKGFKEGIDNIVQYSAALNGLDANNANSAMSELASMAQYLKNTFGSAAIPIINAVLPLIRQIATAFATAVNYINQFFSALSGKSSWTRAKQVTVDYASSLGGVESSADSAKDAVEDLKRTILGFDEINKLNDASGSGSNGGSGGGSGGSDTVSVNNMFEEVPIDNKVTEFLSKMKPYIDDIKDAFERVQSAVSKLYKSEGFQYLISTVFVGVLKTISSTLNIIASLVETFTDILNKSEIQEKISGISEAWDKVLKAVESLVESPGFKKVLEVATYVVLDGIQTILEVIASFAEIIKNAFNELAENGTLDRLQDAFEKIFASIRKITNSTLFKQLMSDGIVAAIDAIAGHLDAIGELLGFISSLISGDLPGALEHLVLFFIDVAAIITKSILTPFENIWNALVTLNEKINHVDLSNFRMNWSEQFTEGLDDVKNKVHEIFGELGEISGEEGEKAGRSYGTEMGKAGKGSFTDEMNGTSFSIGTLQAIPKAKTDFINKMNGTSWKAGNLQGVDSVKQNFKSQLDGTSWKAGLFNNMAAIKAGTANYLNGTQFSSGINNKYAIYKDVQGYLNGTQFTSGISNKYNIYKDYQNYMNGTKFQSGINNLSTMQRQFVNQMNGSSFNAYATVTATLKETYSNRTLTFKEGRLGTLFSGGIVGKAVGGIVRAASGRFIDSAQLFMARENGIPEYVGRFGSHSAVANNYQITTGIAEGVAQAQTVQNELLREQNSLLRQIAANGGKVEVSTASITSGLMRQNRRAGTAIVPVGV